MILNQPQDVLILFFVTPISNFTIGKEYDLLSADFIVFDVIEYYRW